MAEDNTPKTVGEAVRNALFLAGTGWSIFEAGCFLNFGFLRFLGSLTFFWVAPFFVFQIINMVCAKYEKGEAKGYGV